MVKFLVAQFMAVCFLCIGMSFTGTAVKSAYADKSLAMADTVFDFKSHTSTGVTDRYIEIYGIVSDKKTLHPIENATVQLDVQGEGKDSQKTDDFGFYSFEVNKERNSKTKAKLTVSAKNYKKKKFKFTLGEKEKKPFAISIGLKEE